MNDEQQAADFNNENARLAYAHVVKVYDDVLSERHRIAERANRTVLVIALFFTALSYGGTNLVLVAQNTHAHAWLYGTSIVLGLLAALALVFAFLSAIVCARLKSTYIPDVQHLVAQAREPDFHKTNSCILLAAMMSTLRTAIDRNVALQRKRDRWTNILDWLPQTGFALTALFVALAFGQRMMLPTQSQIDCQERLLTALLQVKGDVMAKQESEKSEDDSTQQSSKDSTLEDLTDDVIEMRGSDRGGTNTEVKPLVQQPPPDKP